MNRYWKGRYFLLLQKTNSFSEIGEIALEVQLRMPDEIIQICGPISTGGYGSIEKNTQVFSAAIQHFVYQELKVYNQLPLEEALVNEIKRLGKEYKPYDLLEQVYGPMFNSGKLKGTYFIHDWESSQGSTWEHKQAIKKELEIKYLDRQFNFMK